MFGSAWVEYAYYVLSYFWWSDVLVRTDGDESSESCSAEYYSEVDTTASECVGRELSF